MLKTVRVDMCKKKKIFSILIHYLFKYLFEILVMSIGIN